MTPLDEAVAWPTGDKKAVVVSLSQSGEDSTELRVPLTVEAAQNLCELLQSVLVKMGVSPGELSAYVKALEARIERTATRCRQEIQAHEMAGDDADALDILAADIAQRVLNELGETP